MSRMSYFFVAVAMWAIVSLSLMFYGAPLLVIFAVGAILWAPWIFSLVRGL